MGTMIVLKKKRVSAIRVYPGKICASVITVDTPLCTLCLASPKWKNFWTGLRDMTILPSTTQVLAPVMRSLFVMPNQTRRMVHEELAATSLAISAF